MRRDLQEMLDRQATWQRGRAAASWADKLRTAVIMRRAVLAIRKQPANSLTATVASQKQTS